MTQWVQGQKKKQSLGYPVIWNSNNDQDCSQLAPLGSETLSWRWLMKVFPTNDSLRWFKNINNCKYEKLIQEKKWLSISLTNYYFLIYGIISGALIEFLSVSHLKIVYHLVLAVLGGSSLLQVRFLYCTVWASYRSGFPCGAWALSSFSAWT